MNTWNTKELVNVIKSRGLSELILSEIKANGNVSPSEWKSHVNELISNVIGLPVNVSANILNAVIKRL